MNSKKPHVARFFVYYFATFVGLSAFAGGILYERYLGEACCVDPVHADSQNSIIAPPKNALPDVDMDQYWNVWSIIQDKHFDRPAEEQNLFYGSLEGMVRSLKDPYSAFLRPRTVERFTSDLSGKFFGIGAEIGFRDSRLSIIAPLPDTPADKAGLEAGDHIVTIDGKETFDMTIEDAVDNIRGPKGSPVVLGIFRQGFEEIKDISITRGEIIIKSVSWDVEDKILHIKVNQFGSDTMKLFGQAVREGHAKGMDGVVLDLRNNPGGFLTSAVQMASEWIENGPVVIERFSNGEIENYMREGKLRLQGIPTVVLVNAGSASGSEIVAGALQDYGVATLIGTKTFGKGSVQDLIQLDDGSAVKITIAKWFTPLDRGIDGEGIEPDIEVLPAEDGVEDTQLEKALEILKK